MHVHKTSLDLAWPPHKRIIDYKLALFAYLLSRIINHVIPDAPACTSIIHSDTAGTVGLFLLPVANIYCTTVLVGVSFRYLPGCPSRLTAAPPCDNIY